MGRFQAKTEATDVFQDRRLPAIALTAVRWVRGFWKAMALAPGTWGALAEDERAQILIEPFVGIFEIEDQTASEIPDDIDAILDEGAAAIPRTILVLRKLAQIRRQASASGNKVGRNDPCPCGSGRRTASCAGLPSPERNIGQ